MAAAESFAALARPPRPAIARRTDCRSAARMCRDAELTSDLHDALGGDEAAFARIYRAVQPGVLRYLTVLVGADADDVAAETWSQACRDLAAFRGDIDDFRAWISTIARHRGVDHHRSRARRPVDLVADVELPTPTDSAEDLALECMSTERALALIRSLPKDQAEAVLLRAVLGLDAKAAARVLGKRAGAVRTAAYRGLRTLAERSEAPVTGSGRAVSARCDILEAAGADGM
jgi:RNA polymerase sigma-70 factor, ECF subfamily